MQGNQDSQRSYRLSTPSVSFTGGQRTTAETPRASEPQESPDRSRQIFRATNRQIRENRPLDFTLGELQQERQRLSADIAGQAERQRRQLAETAPKLDEFLPDYEKALAGDQGAIQATGQRLQNEFTPREVAPIRADAGAYGQFLRDPSQEAFQTELYRQRGGTYGLNALDAAILAASGRGAQVFQRGRQQLASAYDVVPQIESELRQQEAQRQADYNATIQALRNRVMADEAAMREQAQSEIEAYRNRDVQAELDRIVEQTKLLNPQLAGYFGRNVNLDPFVDRELTFAETLDPEEARRYNVIAELLGQAPVGRLDPEAGINQDLVIAALVAEAQKQAMQREQNREAERRLERSGIPVPTVEDVQSGNVRSVVSDPVLSEILNTRQTPEPVRPVQPYRQQGPTAISQESLQNPFIAELGI